jgi:toxin ParE1/3/4
MAQIVWTEPALQDLSEIANYIALDKFTASQKLVQQVFTNVEHLKKFPLSGRKPPELPKNCRYRELIIGPCRIFYRATDKKILILYVMRSEMQLRNYILSEREATDD